MKKDTTESASSVSCLDMLLEMDFDGNLDKRDDRKFSIVNFPYIYSNLCSIRGHRFFFLFIVFFLNKNLIGI